MMKLSGWQRAYYAVALLWAATAIAAPAQIFTNLVAFDQANGAAPQYVSLVQGADGNLYGTTSAGGANFQGTIFKITPEGTLTTLYGFCAQTNCPDGASPLAGLLLATDGSFYGTTKFGGNYGYGTVFKATSSGRLTTLHSFDLTDGASPYSALLQANDGNFYGTTTGGGVNDDGTVFKITSKGALTTLHRFTGSDGAGPLAGLVQATNGSFYGTTFAGGTYAWGTVFKITSSGTVTTLHSFDFADGASPFAGLVQASDGSFYGTTAYGGSSGNCAYNCGTVFKITSEGNLTTLQSFDFDNGANPFAGLVQATDGILYGTTDGEDQTEGSVFKITSEGALTTLYKFCSQDNCADGSHPDGGLVQATNGTFYGTTSRDGAGFGTVFSLDLGLGPFVRLVRESGKVGAPDGMLGQGFKGTTSVSFHGTQAKFSVVSDTLLKTKVPGGATTGFVTVTTPSGTLTSNKIFRVRPQLLSFDPPSGPVGTQVTITGVSLTQTQGVGFGDRVPAQFTVNSDTQVTATVPQGAKTGKIGVETKGGVAISAGKFMVTP